MKKIFPRLETYTDYATYNAALALDDDEAVQVAIEHFERSGITAFLTAVPSYYTTERNAERLIGWCTARGVPTTLWNLTIAFRDLSEDGQLEAAPPPEQPEVDKNRGVIHEVGDALAEYVCPPEEQEALDKLKDDVHVSDATRKARDRKLALLAGQQRRELESQNLFRSPVDFNVE